MDLQGKLCDHVTGSLKRSPSFKVFRSRNNSSTEASNEEKIRRHIPIGKGEYSVACLDLMCDSEFHGSFFRLYYPTTKTDIYKRDKQWPLWLPRKQYGEGYASFLGRHPKVVGKLFNWMGGDVYVPALWQGPVCQSNRTFPVVIFSHGLGGNRTTNTTMCCELASQGFIVASVEHRDGSASMTYHLQENIERSGITVADDSGQSRRHTVHRTNIYSETWKPFERFEPWDDHGYRNKQMHHRADECIWALDILSYLNNGVKVHNCLGGHFDTKQFKNRIAMADVSVVGHSFGGATCLCTLSKDKRFRVGVVLDGWMHPLDEDVYNNVSQPVLMINMETFQWKKNVEQMQRIISKGDNRVMITVRGTCHQSVTDFQFLVSKPLGRFLDVRHTLSPKTAMDVCNKGTLGFLWKYLGHEGKEYYEDILTGNHEHVMLGTNVDLTEQV